MKARKFTSTRIKELLELSLCNFLLVQTGTLAHVVLAYIISLFKIVISAFIGMMLPVDNKIEASGLGACRGHLGDPPVANHSLACFPATAHSAL